MGIYETMAKEPIKLSELEDSQKITVNIGGYSDPYVTNKADYMKSGEYLDRNSGEYKTGFPKVHLAVAEIVGFNLIDALENIGDDMYEDWYEDVCNAIKEKLDVDAIEKQVNDVLGEYPTYFDGRQVDTEN